MSEIYKLCNDTKKINEFNKQVMSSFNKIEDDNEKIVI
jgi:hypothetical protein